MVEATAVQLVVYLDVPCAPVEAAIRRWLNNDGIFLDIFDVRHDYSEPALREM